MSGIEFITGHMRTWFITQLILKAYKQQIPYTYVITAFPFFDFSSFSEYMNFKPPKHTHYCTIQQNVEDIVK